MNKFEALIEINPEKVENLAEYIAYCKYYFKPKKKKQIKFYNNLDEIKNDFPFLIRDIRNNSKYKSNETLKDFPLNWLKNEVIGKENKYINLNNDSNIQKLKQISGIYSNLTGLQNYINKLPKYSFAIWFKFKLKAPYFSKDDDEFYIIQNPILKETNFKVPMVRGSSWKGALASAFRELINKNNDLNSKRVKVESFLRVFGAGSESIKAIESYIFDKSKDLKKAKENLLEFIFFELGLEVNSNLINRIDSINNKNGLLNIIEEKLSKKLEDNQRNLPLEFQTHKGRAIFYPTYFDRLSLEIINPHDRRKRAGTVPIHYEVVPEDTEGIFQLIYIPFDAVLKEEKDVREEAQEDLANIIKALSELSNKGIGAKTKLGWGRFEIRYLFCFRNFA